MGDILQSIRISIGEFGVKDAIDILLVTFIIYGLLIITRKTRAIQGFGRISFICADMPMDRFDGGFSAAELCNRSGRGYNSGHIPTRD